MGREKLKKAMIMAAGVGSRLEPITNFLPKPIIPIVNVPMMDILISNLKDAEIFDAIANTHYLASQIENKYKRCQRGQFTLEFNRENKLSGTAGGLLKCKDFFEDETDFLVLSADGLFDIDLNRVIDAHFESNAIMTMVLKEIDYSQVCNFGTVIVDEFGYIDKFEEKPKLEEAKSNLINTGIYVFKKGIFEYIKEGFCDFANDVFPKLLKQHKKINTFVTSNYWSDIGTIDQYSKSTRDILESKLNLNCFKFNKNKDSISSIKDSRNIAKDVEYRGFCCVGDNCIIENGVILDNTIVWDNVKIKENVELIDCIVTNDVTVDFSARNKVFTKSCVLV